MSAWATAGKHLKQFGVAAPVPKQGHYEICRETKEKIRDFLKRPGVSRPAPDRSVYSVDLDGNKSRTGIRFLEKTAWALYEDFCVEFFREEDDPTQPGQRAKKPLLSAAQWYREIPVEYKEPEKETGTIFFDCSFFFLKKFQTAFRFNYSKYSFKKEALQSRIYLEAIPIEFVSFTFIFRFFSRPSCIIAEYVNSEFPNLNC